MKVVCIGGGPAGLYFAILMKKADPAHRVTVLERNRPEDTFGFGVVFSDATQENLAQADRPTHERMAASCARWDDIDVHYQGGVIRSTGHGFSGLARPTLLSILGRRCEELGVDVRFQKEVSADDLLRIRESEGLDLMVAADGSNSTVRSLYAEGFRPRIDWRPNRFVWLGTRRSFPAFTFYFKWDAAGLWRVHAYQYERGHSTFIVETTEETWRAAGMDAATEDETLAFCEALFAPELEGHRLVRNRSIWRSFPTIRSDRWHHENVVLLGDAAHTVHFSIGSGTKIAMEDAIALANALRDREHVSDALAAYEAERRPVVESLQRAAQVSLQWFEETERYMSTEPLQFGFNLLTRSFRITHDNLKLRDPAFVAHVDRWFAAEAAAQAGVAVSLEAAPPPLFTPFKLRELVLENRVVVSPMCQYRAEDGVPGDWHLVHLGSRAVGGAGLVFAEMTDVSREGRISPGCAGLYKPEHVPAWRRIVEFVHAHSRAAVAMQLGHAGRKGSTRLAWEGMDEPLEDGGWPILAPSALPWFPHSPVPKEMDRSDMLAVRDDFVRAAEWAEEAGFDLLELHFAHGYLLASFVSPLTNRRNDEYGGPLESRMRFPLEVFDAVRAVWPAHKPVSVRISAVDWAPGGHDSADAVAVAKLLKAHGCDILDVSAGQTVSDAKPVYGRQFQTPFSDRIRQEAGIPTMAVGNISSYTDVNTILAAGRADLCVLARAHLWDPYWTRHAAYEMGHSLPWPDPYGTLDRYKPRFT
ncbi:MAG: bifunctional salicylyl-CoA 5-hydroxylase/oxidoreductase [Gemmatimonadota bacterium]